MKAAKTKRKRGRPPLYQWGEWFGRVRDHGEVVLSAGDHYKVTQESMYAQIKDEASARGINVRILDLNSGFLIRSVYWAN